MCRCQETAQHRAANSCVKAFTNYSRTCDKTLVSIGKDNSFKKKKKMTHLFKLKLYEDVYPLCSLHGSDINLHDVIQQKASLDFEIFIPVPKPFPTTGAAAQFPLTLRKGDCICLPLRPCLCVCVGLKLVCVCLCTLAWQMHAIFSIFCQFLK